MSDYSAGMQEILTHYGWTVPKKTGWFTTKCLEHGDSKASCRVNLDIGAVHCQGCDFSHDTISVIQFYENVGFKDAVSRYASILNLRESDLPQSARRGSSRLPSDAGRSKRDSRTVPNRGSAGASKR